MQRQEQLFLVFGAVTLLAAKESLGAGFDLPDQDAFAIGRGMAVVATADNPSAIYYNPAGITQLEGNHFRAGLYGLALEPSYSPSAPRSGSYDNQAVLHATPQFYYTYTPETGLVSYGFGAYVPYGLGLRWPQDTGFRTVGTESSLSYFTMNPVVALKVLPNLSIGAGITVNYAQIDLQQGLFSPNLGTDGFRFKGDGWDVGYNLGVLWKPHEKISLGATFRSSTSVSLRGRTEFYNNTPILPVPGGGTFPMQRVDASAGFPFPLKTILGVSYRPTPKWNIEFDADYTDWNAVGTVNVKQDTAFPPFLPKTIPIVLNWASSWYYEFGATRYLEKGWRVSAGYIYNENSVPDAHYTPLVADQDRHFLSVGLGRVGKRWDFDVGYQFGFSATRTVTGSAASGIGQTADGRYDFISHALAASVELHF